MPQILQKVCLAMPVPNEYVEIDCLPVSNLNLLKGTIKCKKPDLVHTEQLQ